MRKLLLSLIAFGCAASANADTLLGPAYPAPGGSSYSSTGNLRTGTLVGTYSGFDLNATDTLYWGADSIKLAMDGAYDSAGETLAFSLADSNLAGGIAVYKGATTIYEAGNPVPVSTIYTLKLTDTLGNALALTGDSNSLGLGGPDFPLLEVTGSFVATQTLTANGDYYQHFFDNAPYKAPGSGGSLLSSVSRDFYYTANVPEPATWAMMVIGFGAVGFTMRRRRVVFA